MSNKEEQLDEMLIQQHNSISKSERMGFGIRFGAYMLDFLFIMLVGVSIGLIIGDELAPFIFGNQMDQFNESANLLGPQFSTIMSKTVQISAGTSITVLILFILEGALGQSVGKMLLKIKNTNVDGTPASPNKLWLRSTLKYGSSLLSLLGGISGLIFIGTIGSLWGLVIFVGFFFAFGDNKQTIHDMIAKTVVMKK